MFSDGGSNVPALFTHRSRRVEFKLHHGLNGVLLNGGWEWRASYAILITLNPTPCASKDPRYMENSSSGFLGGFFNKRTKETFECCGIQTLVRSI